MSEHDSVDAVAAHPGDLVSPHEDLSLSPRALDEADQLELRGTRKREREVSLEPATPKSDEFIAINESGGQERRMPAPASKKNRLQLETTTEEDEVTPPGSPSLNSTSVPSADLSMSPPYETKVRQISKKVRCLKWEDRDIVQPFEQTSGTEMEISANDDIDDPQLSAKDLDVRLGPPAEITKRQEHDQQEQQLSTSSQEALASSSAESLQDKDDQLVSVESKEVQDTKIVKSGTDEYFADSGNSLDALVKPIGAEQLKRARDDTEDDNPREKKRSTPPPDERRNDEVKAEEESSNVATEPIAPKPKLGGGFLAYASASSPFASAKGPSLFGSKSKASPAPLAGTSNGNATALTSALGNKDASVTFAISNSSSSSVGNAVSLTVSPTGTKRSGFEAFAVPSSPFIVGARAKSPPPDLGLSRSKSPSRRGSTSTSINAFKSYAGSGVQAFTPSPPIKKQRQDLSKESQKPGKKDLKKLEADAEASGGGENGVSSEASDEDTEKTEQSTLFGERLRSGKDSTEGNSSNEEQEKPLLTEQEVQTGEEDEDTVYQVRGKLYVLSSQNTWKERGTGQLKLNVRKSDGRGARLIMRKEAVFALLLNVSLFRGMRCMPAQDPRYVRFSCIENGSTAHYNLRVSNAKLASELIDEINANIPGNEVDVV